MPKDTPLDLIRRVEHARARRSLDYAGAMASLHPDWPVATLSLGGAVLTFVHHSSPVNGARGLGLAGPVSLDQVLRIEEFFAQRSSPVKVDVCPLLDGSLTQRLLSRGYKSSGSLAVLYLALAQPRPPLQATDVVATRARADQAALWLSTTASGFDSSEEPDELACTVLEGNFYAANSTPYLASLQGKVVGGAALFADGKAAELGSDSTLPTFRRRGVHSALIGARLAEAIRQGINLAIFCAEPESQSQRNAERHGFRLAYLTQRLVKHP